MHSEPVHLVTFHSDGAGSGECPREKECLTSKPGGAIVKPPFLEGGCCADLSFLGGGFAADFFCPLS